MPYTAEDSAIGARFTALYAVLCQFREQLVQWSWKRVFGNPTASTLWVAG